MMLNETIIYNDHPRLVGAPRDAAPDVAVQAHKGDRTFAVQKVLEVRAMKAE